MAIAVGSLVVGAPGALEDQQATAYPAAAATSGSFQMTNSLDGSAILRGDGLKPGGSTSGTVTITNAGDLEGAFSLSKSSLADDPGPGAGLLSRRLDLVVTDVTGAAAGATVYSGKLADMQERPLGTFAAGEARTYRFEARLPDSADDNPYQAARASFQFDWTAEATAEDGSTAEGGSTPDKTAPRLSFRVARRQRARRALVVKARCDEPCRLGLTGKLTMKKVRKKPKLGSRRLSPSIPADSWKTLKLKLPRKVLAAARKSLAAKRPVKVTLRLTATDAAGNVGVRTFKVKLKR